VFALAKPLPLLIEAQPQFVVTCRFAETALPEQARDGRQGALLFAEELAPTDSQVALYLLAREPIGIPLAQDRVGPVLGVIWRGTRWRLQITDGTQDKLAQGLGPGLPVTDVLGD